MRLSSLLSFGLLITLALPAPGCAGRRGNGAGDDDDVVIGLGGLDIDGDGVLTDDDLDSGEVAVFSRIEGGDDAGDYANSWSGGYLAGGDGAYSVNGRIGGAIPADLALWFDATDPETFELAVGEGDIAWANATSEEYLIWAESSSGSVTITEASSTQASGYFEGEVVFVVASQNESPTGETIVIEGLAFNDLPIGAP